MYFFVRFLCRFYLTNTPQTLSSSFVITYHPIILFYSVMPLDELHIYYTAIDTYCQVLEINPEFKQIVIRYASEHEYHE